MVSLIHGVVNRMNTLLKRQTDKIFKFFMSANKEFIHQKLHTRVTQELCWGNKKRRQIYSMSTEEKESKCLTGYNYTLASPCLIRNVFPASDSMSLRAQGLWLWRIKFTPMLLLGNCSVTEVWPQSLYICIFEKRLAKFPLYLWLHLKMALPFFETKSATLWFGSAAFFPNICPSRLIWWTPVCIGDQPSALKKVHVTLICMPCHSCLHSTFIS